MSTGEGEAVSGLRIDYDDLAGPTEDEGPEIGWDGGWPGVRRMAWYVAKRVLIVFALMVLPFAVLIRGGVFAYRAWGFGPWVSLLFALLVTAAVTSGYAWLLSRRLGAGGGLRRLMIRGAAALAVVYVGYALVFIASANVKTEDVRAEYSRIHPLLRVAASALILVDPGSVLTDAARTREDYWLMGLTPNEASLHFEQTDGFVHALDLRTTGRPEWRNRAVEVAFWAFGFHSLRHVGTADHLHISLRPAG